MYGACVPGHPEETTASPSGDAMSHIESVPTTWDDTRDGAFFRIVTHVLPAHVVEGASILLGTNDAELAPLP